MARMSTSTIAIVALVAGAGLLLLASKASADPEANLPAWRRGLLKCAREHVARGTLYQWGGGRDPAHDWGVDCSGLIIDCA